MIWSHRLDEEKSGNGRIRRVHNGGTTTIVSEALQLPPRDVEQTRRSRSVPKKNGRSWTLSRIDFHVTHLGRIPFAAVRGRVHGLSNSFWAVVIRRIRPSHLCRRGWTQRGEPNFIDLELDLYWVQRVKIGYIAKRNRVDPRRYASQGQGALSRGLGPLRRIPRHVPKAWFHNRQREGVADVRWLPCRSMKERPDERPWAVCNVRELRLEMLRVLCQFCTVLVDCHGHVRRITGVVFSPYAILLERQGCYCTFHHPPPICAA